MKFRVGDVVSLEGKVVGTHAGVAYVVDVKEGHHGGNASLMMKEGQLALVKAAPAAVGDHVVHKNDKGVAYEVLATHGVWAWVSELEGRGGLPVFRLDDLVVVERA